VHRNQLTSSYSASTFKLTSNPAAAAWRVQAAWKVVRPE
jgi:hypothetical protein